MAAYEPAAVASSDLLLVVLPFRAAVPASRSTAPGIGHTRARTSLRPAARPASLATLSLRASTPPPARLRLMVSCRINDRPAPKSHRRPPPRGSSADD